MPVKVEQINEYLFSDTVQRYKTKSGNDEISQGQVGRYVYVLSAVRQTGRHCFTVLSFILAQA